MEPRARVSVWPGRRRVPGIVAPDSWGARGAECLPRDVLRHTLPAAVSLWNGPTACHGLCHRHGSGTTEARPPASSVPPAPHGDLGVLWRHLVNSGPDFRSSSVFNENRTDTCRLIESKYSVNPSPALAFSRSGGYSRPSWTTDQPRCSVSRPCGSQSRNWHPSPLVRHRIPRHQNPFVPPRLSPSAPVRFARG